MKSFAAAETIREDNVLETILSVSRKVNGKLISHSFKLH